METFIHSGRLGSVLRIRGEDAPDYLQSQLTINVADLARGSVRYGLRLNAKGRVLAGAYVLRTGEEEFLLVSRKTKAEDWLALLEENVVADEVEFGNETMDWRIHTLWGEDASVKSSGPQLETPESGKFLERDDGLIFLDPRLPPGSVALLTPGDSLPKVGGIADDARPVDPNVLELRRIGSCMVSVPDEIGPGELPQEGGLEKHAVDFDKGCYLGQEMMARMHAIGKARRQAVTVRKPGEGNVEVPADLYAGKRRIGTLKSLVMGEGGGLGIAIINESGISFLEKDGLALGGPEGEKITLP